MALTITDFLNAMPSLMARETDPTRLSAAKLLESRLEETKNRVLLCDFHGIQVFEYQGKRKLELTGEIQQRMQSLADQTSDSLRDMVADLTALAHMEDLPVEAVSKPPEALYDNTGLLNGEAFQKSAEDIWLKTTVHRVFFEYIRTRLARKVKPLYSKSEKERIRCANSLKRELKEAIDIIAKGGGGRTHGAATLVDYQMPDGSSRFMSLPFAALKSTCDMILANLTAPTKAEVRMAIKNQWPLVNCSESGWAKIWKSAGLGWLDRKRKW